MKTGSVVSQIGVTLALVALVGLAGCPSEPEASKPGAGPSDQLPAGPEGVEPAGIEVTSTAFEPGERIPARHTEDGEDVSPPLSWSGVPEGAKELALICDDPDAPSAEPWVHWVLYKIPPETESLPEGVAKTARLDEPPGALQGENSWSRGQTIGYRGPAPPRGGPHRYFFKLYALDAQLDLGPEEEKKALVRAMDGHVLGVGELIGTYQR